MSKGTQAKGWHDEQLVERLRARGRPVLPDIDPGDQDCWEAAKAIERLQAERNEREKQFADLLESHEEDLDALEKAERELAERKVDQTSLRQHVNELSDWLAEARAENERKNSYFTRIIQVRGGAGMLQGKEALDEMARLAGEALAAPAPEPEKCRRCGGRGRVASRTQKCTGSGLPKTCSRCGGSGKEPATEREAKRRVKEEPPECDENCDDPNCPYTH